MRKQLLLCVLLLLVSMGVYGQVKPVAKLHYNNDGKFKIVQITDTHVIPGDPRSEITLKNLEAVLDAEKPDFVIHTGDIVYGKPAAKRRQSV